MSNVGQQNIFSDASEFNLLDFVIARALDKIQTVSLVSVVNVNTAALTVDVQVLTNLVTGSGASIPQGVIYGRPYLRLQGGTNGVICDPAAGDNGLMVFCSRDISAVVAAAAAANPGSNRRFSWSDGVYVFGVLNATPTQYVQFTSGGIIIESPHVTASGILEGAQLKADNGYTGTFQTGDSRTATVVSGIITAVA
jgi:hypothetical protein